MYRFEQSNPVPNKDNIEEEEEADHSPLLSSSQTRHKQRKGSRLSTQSSAKQEAFVSYGNTSFEAEANTSGDYELSLRKGTSGLASPDDWHFGAKTTSPAGIPADLTIQQVSNLAPLFTSDQLFSNQKLQKPNPLFVPGEAQASNPLFSDNLWGEESPKDLRHPAVKFLSTPPPLSRENSRDNPVYSPPESPRDSPGSSFDTSSGEHDQLRSLLLPVGSSQSTFFFSSAMTTTASDIGWQESETKQRARSRLAGKQQPSAEAEDEGARANPTFGESLSIDKGDLPVRRMSSVARNGLSRQPSVDDGLNTEPIGRENSGISSKAPGKRVSYSGPLHSSGPSMNMEPISHSQELQPQQRSQSRRSSRGDPYTGAAIASQRQAADALQEQGRNEEVESTVVDISMLEDRGTAVSKEDWGYLFGAQEAEEAAAISIEAELPPNSYEDLVPNGQEPLSLTERRRSLSGVLRGTLSSMSKSGRNSGYNSLSVTPTAAAQRGVSSEVSQAGEEVDSKRPRKSSTFRRVSDGRNEEQSGQEEASVEKKSRWLRSHPVDRGLGDLESGDVNTGGRSRLGMASPGDIALVSMQAPGAGEKSRIARKLSESSSESQPASPSGDHPLRGKDAAFEPLVPLKPLKPLKIIPNQVVLPVKLKPVPAPVRKQKRFWEKSAVRWTAALGLIILVIVVVAVLA